MTQLNLPMEPAAAMLDAIYMPLERAHDIANCGAKAANLGRLLRAGLQVPPGFVFSARAFADFVEHTGLQPAIAHIENEFACADPLRHRAAEARAQALFAATALPEALRRALSAIAAQLPGDRPLVVRSSAVGEDGANASFAGLLDSKLNVSGIDALEHALKACWASRWSARAAAYARGPGRPLVRMAVIVQTQIDARFAGVLFTHSPHDANEMLCEYCTGLADRLVSGQITPQQIAIDRATLVARQRPQHPTEPRVSIEDEQVEALACAAIAAERVFGCPQDIEWVLDQAHRLWLVQSRPITTYVAGRAEHTVWSNANVNENFPAPVAPLLYSIAAPGYTHYFTNLGRAFGLARGRLARMQSDLAVIIGVHGGRMYYNLSAIHRVLRAAPFGEPLVAWFNDFTGAPGTGRTELHNPGFVRSVRDAVELGWIACKTVWQYLFIERRVAAFEQRIDQYAARTAPGTLAEKSDAQLRDEVRAFLDIRLHRWTDAALADAAAMVCYGLLKAVATGTFPAPEAAQLHNSFLKGLSGLKSAEPIGELWALAQSVSQDPVLRDLFTALPGARIAERLGFDERLARFNGQFQAYLERWGFRCSGELMLTVPSFQERPGELLEIVRSYACSTDAGLNGRLDAQRASRETITADALTRAARQRLFRFLPWPNRAVVLRALIRSTQAAIGLRERARYQQALLYSRLRRIALELGARLSERRFLNARDDIFFLTIGEIDELVSGVAMFPQQTPELIALRRNAHVQFERETPPDTFVTARGSYARSPRKEREPGAHADAYVLHGSSVCAGIARGPAKTLADVAETPTLCPGDVLVTRQTDPGWAPAFAVIGALVLERGGMLSHGAILAREYGIPTVVGIEGATARIGYGRMVEVDGDCGDVRLLA